MSRQGISTGTAPNDGTGDSLLAGAKKINENFQEIYDSFGNGTDLLSGNPNLTVGFITATGASFTGGVTIGGTLTYEDVTNIDSVGVITARLGVNVTEGEIAVGAAFSVGQAGVVTATSFIKSGGTSSQFLKADGSVDSSTYLTSETQTLDDVLGLGNTSDTGLSVGVVTASYFQSSLGISTNSGTTTAQINVDSTGNQLIITVPGVGSTTLPLT